MMEAKRSAVFKLVDSKRMRIYGRMQHIYDARLNLDTKTKLRVFKRLALEIDDLRGKFEEVMDEFNRIQTEEDEDFSPNFAALNAFDDMYYEVKDLLNEISSDKPQGEGNSNTERPGVRPRLPKIELMEFDGDPLKWPLFFQTFKHLIHDNSSLDEVSKVHYLLGKLKGKALNVCSSILPTPENYLVLWNALVEKYEDKRALAGVYLGQILDFKPMAQTNVSQLGSFIEKIDSAMRALYQLQLDDLGDFVMTSICLSKLDVETRILFERSLGKNEFPRFEQLSDFIKEQFKILSRTSGNVAKIGSRFSKGLSVQAFAVREKGASSTPERATTRCELCRSSLHRIYKCSTFLGWSQGERKRFAFRRSLCFNCLKPGHPGSACPSNFNCSICQQDHHTLLHSANSTGEVEKGEQPSEKTPVSLVSTLPKPVTKETVLLSTATVLVRSKAGERLRMRVLIDSASQCNFITSQLCRRLKLPVAPASTSVIGIGAAVKTVQGQVTVHFRSRFHPTEYKMKAWVIDKITDSLPSFEINSSNQEMFQGWQLADDSFTQSGTIDGMIGAELAPMLLGAGKPLGPGGPMAIESPLGLIVMGRVQTPMAAVEVQSFCCANLTDLVQKFWDLENLEVEKLSSPEDDLCEKRFSESVRRGEDGRYTVALPFEHFPPGLGSSLEMARRRFLALERKFSKQPEYGKMYGNVIRDYLEQGHMRLVNSDSKTPGYYIPHHGILKPGSTSTPLRVVFDASATTSNGRSLNDSMFAGPKLQNELFDLLVRFRTFEIAMTADVKQMYRQIWVCEEHQPFQRLLWRFNREEPISVYELTTVTFGVKASPFLALRVVKQLALDEAQKFPLAAARVSRELYMDDVVSSTTGLSSAWELYQQWVGLFKAGGFQLVKWATNSAGLLAQIPQEARRGGVVEFPTDILTVLGLQWNPESDELIFKTAVEEKTWNKRSVLSTLARIWDPLGLLVPVTLAVKLLMKELWALQLGWDDALPKEVEARWQRFVEELPELSNFKVPRHLGVRLGTKVSLVGFADASEKAYAAVVYLIMEDDQGGRRSTLLCAKSKVAPMKPISIPRLELCGALLLARLVGLVKDIYEGILSFQDIYVFSDSTVVLQWLQGAPHRWKTFVANRVTKIQKHLPKTQWRHVRGEENPADCASRGLSPRKLLEDRLWLEGPNWLKADPEDWRSDLPKGDIEEIDLEENQQRCLVVAEQESPLQRLIERCGSWSKLLRSTVYLLRFCRKLQRGEFIQASDLNAAEEFLIKFIQRKHFGQLIADIQSKRTVSKEFRVLLPFLHEELVRVGGRLQNSTLSFGQRHPILLPKGDHLVDLLVDYTHRKYLHAGPTLLAGLLRQKYWILGARNTVRKCCHLCNRCFKCKPVAKNPIMASLPASRVSEVKPFAHTGIDFAGPFSMKLSRTRGAKVSKGYLCLFVCMSTRAVHLECASDLSTDTCLAAIKRFLARRGPCSSFYTDQGTNFIGAKRHLTELGRLLESKEFKQQLAQELLEQRIEWKLNPPAAPHFGGLWEAGVKAVKYHLLRVIGEQILTFEEFATVLCQIEAVLNSRPLCWLSTDPSDPVALTPAHFLTLVPLQDLPAAPVNAAFNRLERRELLDKVVQSYWARWRLEYLTTLQRRMKWNTPTCPVQPGLLVLVHQENTPPLRWPCGRVQEVYPGVDGVVRVALVRTKNGLFKRPVHKLAPLPSQ